MDFFSCRSKSISDLASRFEPDEVLGFVGCECLDFDTEDVRNLILIPLIGSAPV